MTNTHPSSETSSLSSENRANELNEAIRYGHIDKAVQMIIESEDPYALVAKQGKKYGNNSLHSAALSGGLERANQIANALERAGVDSETVNNLFMVENNQGISPFDMTSRDRAEALRPKDPVDTQATLEAKYLEEVKTIIGELQETEKRPTRENDSNNAVSNNVEAELLRQQNTGHEQKHAR